LEFRKLIGTLYHRADPKLNGTTSKHQNITDAFEQQTVQ